MQNFNMWFRSVMDLVAADEEEALALIQRFASSPGGAVVLPEGELTALEALCYARTLLELGHDIAAEEVVHEVIATELGGEGHGVVVAA